MDSCFIRSVCFFDVSFTCDAHCCHFLVSASPLLFTSGTSFSAASFCLLVDTQHILIAPFYSSQGLFAHSLSGNLVWQSIINKLSFLSAAVAMLHGAVAMRYYLPSLCEWLRASEVGGGLRRLHLTSISSHELKSSDAFPFIHLSIKKTGRHCCCASSHLIHALQLEANPKIITGVISNQCCRFALTLPHMTQTCTFCVCVFFTFCCMPGNVLEYLKLFSHD